MLELNNEECNRIALGMGICALVADRAMIRAGYAAGYRAAQADHQSAATPSKLSGLGSTAANGAAQAATDGPAADHQNGVQRHEASAGCALGASSLESGNAREATCLNGEHDARRCSPTQQGQLGTNAGSIPAAPTDHIADLCKRLRKWYDKERGCVWEAADALERLEREIDDTESALRVWRGRSERAEAERDALRECVKAADAMRLHSLILLGRPRGYADYDAARAKVKMP